MKTLWMLLGLLGLGTSAIAADPVSPVGNWEGILPVNAAIELRLVFHVEKTKDGGLKATFDSPDESIPGLAAEAKAKDDGSVTLSVPIIQGEFTGKLDAKGTAMEGTWKQKGQDFPMKLTKMTGPEPTPEIWEGKLKTGAVEIRVVARISKKADGTLRATFDSPDQGAVAIKVDSVTKDKTTLSFESKVIRGEFLGKLSEDGTEAVGNWKQAGATMPLTLKKTDKVTQIKRPQLPKKPYPYREDLVTYPNKSAGITLAGTLTMPQGEGPFPVVLLITGSGPQDRDETLLGHKPFLVLADNLTRRGIAVLRVDDRGVGKSTGSQAKATSQDFATDVEAGVAYLKSRKELDPKKIGLMGHSEGGVIGPIVAAKSPDVAFLVMLAGTGVPGNDIMTAQASLIAKAAGASDEDVAKQAEFLKKIDMAFRTVKDETELNKTIDALFKELTEKLTEAQRKSASEDGVKALGGQGAMLKTPWFRYFLSFDPRPTLAKVRCPVLAINGEKDLQVPPKQNLPEIEKAIKSGGNTNVTIVELPGLNHLFQTCKTGSPSEYAQIEETFSPEALKLVGDWIVKTTGAK